MPMELAIFDLDGTLVDSMGVWRNVSGDFLKGLDITPGDDLEQKVRTMSFTTAANFVKKEYDLDVDIEDIMQDWFTRVRKAYNKTIQEKVNAMNYLKYLKSKNTKMCIATAANINLANSVTKRLGMDKFMEFTITVEDLGVNKDKPDIFLYCADRLKVPVEKCSVFEDSLHAIKSAKSGGFHTIGMKDSENLDQWEQIVTTADVAVDHFGQLITPGTIASSS